jgi:peptide deformylase
MKEIVQEGNPVLRQKAEPVPIETLPNKEIDALLNDMKEALDQKPNGVALAAPQVGVSQQIFIVSERALSEEEHGAPLVYINPHITNRSKKTATLEEGCLSVSAKYGKVPRAQQVTITAYDREGKPFMRGASGLLAQIFQHEVDHLNGILYIDTAIETFDIIE